MRFSRLKRIISLSSDYSHWYSMASQITNLPLHISVCVCSVCTCLPATRAGLDSLELKAQADGNGLWKGFLTYNSWNSQAKYRSPLHWELWLSFRNSIQRGLFLQSAPLIYLIILQSTVCFNHHCWISRSRLQNDALQVTDSLMKRKKKQMLNWEELLSSVQVRATALVCCGNQGNGHSVLCFFNFSKFWLCSSSEVVTTENNLKILTSIVLRSYRLSTA